MSGKKFFSRENAGCEHSWLFLLMGSHAVFHLLRGWLPDPAAISTGVVVTFTTLRLLCPKNESFLRWLATTAVFVAFVYVVATIWPPRV